jgi:Domain of unknown function (DUF4062)
MSVDKRYQVFVSSTYTDLHEERAEVLQALMELDCMPAGMELFPAASEEQWTWIKRVIDESDYYLVIVGGRYGSIAESTGLSFTEMEYRYAIDIGKPIIGFVHQDASKISAGKSEKSAKRRKQLDEFRELVQRKLCKFYSAPADLGAKVSRSVTQLMRQHPATGWVRADSSNVTNTAEALRLRRRVEELEKQLHELGTQAPSSAETLSNGEDEVEIPISFIRKRKKLNKSGTPYWPKYKNDTAMVPISWNDIFAALGPELITPTKEYRAFHPILSAVIETIPSHIFEVPEEKLEEIRLSSSAEKTIKIQLRALGLIQVNNNGEWFLTPYGDNELTRILGIKKDQPSE